MTPRRSEHGAKLSGVCRTTAHVYDLIYELAGKDCAAEATTVADQVLARNLFPGLRMLRQWSPLAGADGVLPDLWTNMSSALVDGDSPALGSA